MEAKIKSTKRTNNTLQNTTHKAKDWSNIWQLPSNMTWKLLHAWVICAACLRHMCCMLESYVLHAWGICAACLSHRCCMLESYVLHAWGICAASVSPCKLDLLHACCKQSSSLPVDRKYQKEQTGIVLWYSYLIYNITIYELFWFSCRKSKTSSVTAHPSAAPEFTPAF